MEEHRPKIIQTAFRLFTTGREFNEGELLGTVDFLQLNFFFEIHVNIHSQALQAKGVYHTKEEISRVEPLPF